MKISNLKISLKSLDNNKAKNIVSMDLKNKSYIADYMIIASASSNFAHFQKFL